jgi:hypothetical protein
MAMGQGVSHGVPIEGDGHPPIPLEPKSVQHGELNRQTWGLNGIYIVDLSDS